MDKAYKLVPPIAAGLGATAAMALSGWAVSTTAKTVGAAPTNTFGLAFAVALDSTAIGANAVAWAQRQRGKKATEAVVTAWVAVLVSSAANVAHLTVSPEVNKFATDATNSHLYALGVFIVLAFILPILAMRGVELVLGEMLARQRQKAVKIAPAVAANEAAKTNTSNVKQGAKTDLTLVKDIPTQRQNVDDLTLAAMEVKRQLSEPGKSVEDVIWTKASTAAGKTRNWINYKGRKQEVIELANKMPINA